MEICSLGLVGISPSGNTQTLRYEAAGHQDRRLEGRKGVNLHSTAPFHLQALDVVKT